MSRYPDPFVLQQNARALRREALAGIALEGAIKWKSLMDLLRGGVSPLPKSHAPYPCQGPAPTHS
jgi:hypothetical protein